MDIKKELELLKEQVKALSESVATLQRDVAHGFKTATQTKTNL